MEELGHRIRRFRKERGWSLEQLAERASRGQTKLIHYTTIGKIERLERKPSGDILINIAQALNVSVERLSGKNEDGYPNDWWRYSFLEDIWEQLPNFPGIGRSHPAMIITENKIYISFYFWTVMYHGEQ